MKDEMHVVKDLKGSILDSLNNLYLVKRASDGLGIKSPCNGSFESTIHFKNGIERKCWLIEINHLHDFIGEYGRCIVEKDDFTGFYSITIYDDYVE